jgi:hypothetical protein
MAGCGAPPSAIYALLSVEAQGGGLRGAGIPSRFALRATQDKPGCGLWFGLGPVVSLRLPPAIGWEASGFR